MSKLNKYQCEAGRTDDNDGVEQSLQRELIDASSWLRTATKKFTHTHDCACRRCTPFIYPILSCLRQRMLKKHMNLERSHGWHWTDQLPSCWDPPPPSIKKLVWNKWQRAPTSWCASCVFSDEPTTRTWQKKQEDEGGNRTESSKW